MHVNNSLRALVATLEMGRMVYLKAHSLASEASELMHFACLLQEHNYLKRVETGDR